MSLINAILTPLFDGLLYPFRSLHPLVGLAFMALLAAIFMLVVFRHVSDQDALARVKRRIQACVLEIRLFNDEPRAILRAQVELLRHSLSYLRLGVIPMVWILPPMVLVATQLQSYYGYREPARGASFVVEAQLTEAAVSALEGRRPQVLLRSSGNGLLVRTPGVWVPAQRLFAWRVELRSPGDYELTFSLDGVEVTKSLDARRETVRRSPLRVRGGILEQLLHPGEPLLAGDGPFQSVGVRLAEGDLRIPGPGWEVHWTVAFFILSLAFALVLKNRLAATIHRQR